MNDDESVPFAPRKRTSIQLADKAEIDSLRAKLAAVDKQREDFFWDKQRAEAELRAAAVNCAAAAKMRDQSREQALEYRKCAERAEAERDALLYNGDSQYCAGMSAGFELGRNDDRAELSRIITQRWNEIADAKASAALNPSPARQGRIPDRTFERDLAELRAFDRMRAERDAMRELLNGVVKFWPGYMEKARAALAPSPAGYTHGISPGGSAEMNSMTSGTGGIGREGIVDGDLSPNSSPGSFAPSPAGREE